MRRHLGMIGLALVSITLGGCGSDKTASAPSTSTTSATFTAEQLSDVLLTSNDLGTGWAETQRDVFSGREAENPSIDPSLWCPAGHGDQLATLAGQQGADVELSLGPTDVPYMIRQQAWTNADVERYFTSVADAVTSCSGATWNDAEGNSYMLQPLEAPTIGDESTSWTVTIEVTGTTPTISFVQQTAARFGAVMMVLQGGATPTTEPDSSGPNYLLVVRVAGDKMTALATP